MKILVSSILVQDSEEIPALNDTIIQGWRKHAKSGGADVLSSQYKCICINDIHCLFTQKWGGACPPCPPYSASYVVVFKKLATE